MEISFIRTPGLRFGRKAVALGLLCGTLLPAAEGSHWWEQEPVRLINVVTSTNQILFREPGALTARKAELGFTGEHFEVMNMPAGLDGTGFAFRSSVAAMAGRDFLRDYLPEARRRGLRVMIYFNVHWVNKSFAAAHSEWVQVRQNGKPLDGVYETGSSMCVNTPYREWVFAILRDLAAYPVDGIFYDGPVFFPETCYCSHCRAKYRAAHGTEMPGKALRRGRAARQLLEFQAQSLAGFLRDSRRILKGINPELALYMNGGLRGGNWATGRMNRVLIGEQDLLGTEGGFLGGDLQRVPIWKPGVNARLLETQAGGKPRVVFSASAHKPWALSMLPAPEIRLLYAGTIANAAGTWFGMWPAEFDLPEMATLRDMNGLLARHGKYFRNTRSEARLAVVWSDNTANFYPGAGAEMMDGKSLASRGTAGNPETEFTGIADAIVRSRVPFDVVDDVSLEKEDLGRYRLLVLPNVACMSEAAAGRLREYVRNGGNVFATFQTSALDEAGEARSDFNLADVFGVHSGGKVSGPRRWDYMREVQQSTLLSGIHRALLPSPMYQMQVRLGGAAQVLAYSEPLAGPMDRLPGVSAFPALSVHSFGKGKAVFFSGDLGNSIQSFHMDELYRMVRNIAWELAPPAVRVDAPGSLEVVLRSQKDSNRLLLHLINSTGEMVRPIARVVPLENVRVTLKVDGPVRGVEALLSQERLKPLAEAAGEVSFVLPRLEEYEVIAVER